MSALLFVLQCAARNCRSRGRAETEGPLQDLQDLLQLAGLVWDDEEDTSVGGERVLLDT